MPGINLPTYGTQKIAQQAAPTPRVAVDVPVMGEGLVKAGNAALGVLNDIKLEADKARVQSYRSQLLNGDIEEMKAYQSRVGADALQFVPEGGGEPIDPIVALNESRKKRSDKLMSTLTEGQKRIAELEFQASGLEYNRAINTHLAAQQKVYQKSANEGQAVVGGKMVLSFPADPKLVEHGMNDIAAATTTDAKGLDPAAVSNMVLKNQSTYALQAFENKVRAKEPIGKSLDHLFKYMTEEDKAKAKELTSKGDTEVTGFAQSKLLYKPGMTENEITDAATKAAGDDPNLYKSIKAFMMDRYHSNAATVAKIDKEVLADITLQMVKPGAELEGLKNSVANNPNISKEARAVGVDHIIKYQEHKLNMANAAEVLNERRFAKATLGTSLRMMSNPDLATMSDDQFLKSLSGISPMHWPDLYRARAQAQFSGGKTIAPSAVVNSLEESYQIKKGSGDAARLSRAVVMAQDYFHAEIVKDKNATKPDGAAWIKKINFYYNELPGTGGLFSSGVAPADISLAGDKSKEDQQKQTKKVMEKYFNGEERVLVGAWLDRKGVDKNNLDNWFDGLNELREIQAKDPERYRKMVSASEALSKANKSAQDEANTFDRGPK